MTELRGKRVAVVGLGRSGAAAARLCLRRGARVTGLDDGAVPSLREDARALAAAGVELQVGPGSLARDLSGMDVVVVSPGVPPTESVTRAAAAGTPVWGEVELAARALGTSTPIVAVGGTNGKSTTTSLVAALLATKLTRVFAGGNLGEPLADHVDEPWDAVVLEVSSFQMERVDTFHPRSAVLLNVTPDHLDRYPSFDAYADAKGNMFLRQGADDVAVIPVGDPLCAAQARRGRGRPVTFGPGGDVDVSEVGVAHEGHLYPRDSLGAGGALAGTHNMANVAAALAAVGPFHLDQAAVARALAAFRGLPHRTALVFEHGGVRFYDDSKGTNVGAAVTALRGLREARAVLIAGGRDKGGSYQPLVEALRAKGRALVVLGEAAAAITRAVGDAVPVVGAKTMEEAVTLAAGLARPGDAVLLSPACSSFDMFRDYAHRGDAFAAAARALTPRPAPRSP